MFFARAAFATDDETLFKVSGDLFFFFVVILHAPADCEISTLPVTSVIVKKTLFLVFLKNK